LAAILSAAVSAVPVEAADVYVRVKVIRPEGAKFRVTTGGFRHGVSGSKGPEATWYLPAERLEVAGGQWSRWLDLTTWPLHKRYDRSGGVAEWPAMSLTVSALDAKEPPGPKPAPAGCALAVEIADRPDPAAIVISFTEKSESSTICFLLPHPLRQKKGEFETGSQMTARHLAWAAEATGGRPVTLRKFALCTSVWGHYDPGLARQAAATLKMLGFNVLGGVPTSVLRDAAMQTYGSTWLYGPDPETISREWKKYADGPLAGALKNDDGRWTYANMHHYVISDEISVVDFKPVRADRLNGWFRDYLRGRGVTASDLGRPIDEVEYPTEAMGRRALPRYAEEVPLAKTPDAKDRPPPWTRRPEPALADLAARKLIYHAARFGQWWSAQRLRQTSDLVRASIRNVKTETLPTDHGFFNAWGPPHLGMGHRLLDLFELGRQETVDLLDAEDWMGLNHMYGPGSTWTGAQTFEYLSAILRSSMTGRPMTLMGLITPSDDGYLRLKACSALGQGAKCFFFWTFGPTYIGTENYWSDLRSEYDGIAKFTRALAQAEDVLFEAAPVRDPVAVLYSVSHDYWHTDDPASFVENRLTWHALRHLGIQPDFLDEAAVEEGGLKQYKACFLTGQCLTRRASAALDAWVKAGGVVYLSAGAATRDEFYEPYVPPFADGLWPGDAARQFIKERHAYNERADLPGIKPMAGVTVTTGERSARLPVIGGRLNLRQDIAREHRIAVFDDGAAAGADLPYGKGRVVGVGFFPMLAYSPFKAGQTTLDEKWPAEPRELVRRVLEAAQVSPAARADVPVVETSLLVGPRGSALVLVNYTYQLINKLNVEVRLPHPAGRAVSTRGAAVAVRRTAGGAALELPLDWTDIILLEKP
jgi:hypothetical protein